MIRRKMICQREQDCESGTEGFNQHLQERGYPDTFVREIGGEVNRTPRSLLLSPPSGEDSDNRLLLIPSHYDKVWFVILTKCIDSIFTPGVEELLHKDNPFTNTLVVKSMRRTSNLKDFPDAVNKAILGNEEEAND